MNIKEYNEIKHYNYDEYCDYLVQKYGAATEPYFTDTYWTKKNKPKQPVANKKATRTKEGLFMHHKQENHVASLSSPVVAAAHDYELQSAENLVPCDYLEHLLLHILICEDPQPFEGEHVGANGTLTWILPALVSFFEKKHIPQEWQVPAFDRIAEHRDSYDALIDRFIHSELIQENCDVTEEELRNLVSDRLVFSHNDIVIEQINDYLKTDNKALVDLGTGLGKTTTALQYAIDHKCNCLVLCHRDIIKDGWKKSAMTLDKRVGKKLEIMSYQGFANHYENIDWSQYDLLICDEAHHCRGPVWGKGVRYVIENKCARVIGLTATPADVGDSLFGGNVCKGLTVPEGIEQGIIHPISYVGAYYSTEDIMEQVGGFEDQELIGELNLAINNTPTLKEIILTNMPKGPRKCIIFTQTIEAMDQAIDILKDIYPNGEYKKIHSKMSSDEVESNKKWFEDTNEGFLCAVNMISEGAHYRGVNTIFMFRKTKSELLYNQQIGRIITLSKYNNPHSILFDLVNNANSIEVSKSLKISIGKRKEILEKEKNDIEQASQIIIKDYTSDIVKILNDIKKRIHNELAYTEEEDNIIKEYYPIEGQKCIARLKDRSAHSIHVRAFKLGIKYIGEDKIYCFELNRVFPNTNFAATELGLNTDSIRRACNNWGTLHGYRFCFLKDKDKYCFNANQGLKKKVICINTLKVYDSIAEAAKDTNANSTKIIKCCKEKQGTSGGYSWLYLEDYEKGEYYLNSPRNMTHRRKKVYQYEKNGAFIREFSSSEDAIEKLQIPNGKSNNINNACSGHQNTSYGYRWSYIKADNYFDIKE